MRKKITYILIADGARARIYVNEGVGKGVRPVSGVTHQSHVPPHNRDLTTDKPGRAFSSVGSGRSAMHPSTDWIRIEKHRFAREIARVLDAAAESRSFDRLIVVAPPATLGDLRRELGEQTLKLLHAELPKDLTRHSEDELPEHLGEVLAV